MFIIHQNGNETSIQPILISNSTSFMFNNIFCEMKGKKVIYWGGGAGGNAETVLITSWKCNFSIYLDIQVYYLDIQVYYLDIQAITTLCAFYWFFMCQFLVFIHVCTLQVTTAILKSDLSGTKTASPPTVFNLQASDWVHCEEERGAYYLLQRFIDNIFFFFYKFLKLLIFPQKICTFQKIP